MPERAVHRGAPLCKNPAVYHTHTQRQAHSHPPALPPSFLRPNAPVPRAGGQRRADWAARAVGLDPGGGGGGPCRPEHHARRAGAQHGAAGGGQRAGAEPRLPRPAHGRGAGAASGTHVRWQCGLEDCVRIKECWPRQRLEGIHHCIRLFVVMLNRCCSMHHTSVQSPLLVLNSSLHV